MFLATPVPVSLIAFVFVKAHSRFMFKRNMLVVILSLPSSTPALLCSSRLGLKGQQERDIVHVLVDCCLQEKSFNGYYAVLAEKFCAHDRRFQVTQEQLPPLVFYRGSSSVL